MLKYKNPITDPIEDIQSILDNIDNDDDTLDILMNAMEYYCGTHDKCEGMKHAIMLCVIDQYQNHPGEDDPEHLIELKRLLSLTS